MNEEKMQQYLKDVITNIPSDWITLTTHRLDIYNESLAKKEFLEHFENLYNSNDASTSSLNELPTAFDYIRLGHPLSSILEWSIAQKHQLKAENVISFDSKTAAILAVLRKNLLAKKKTQIVTTYELPEIFNTSIVKEIYGYNFEVKKVNNTNEITAFDGSVVFIQNDQNITEFTLTKNVDFFINLDNKLGSIILINGNENNEYISEIQHVRRRETISMTPSNSLKALQLLTNQNIEKSTSTFTENKAKVINEIQYITGTKSNALVASSGLSMQYAIMMGLVHDALEKHKGKDIRFIVPPNCYGGTNDQARRVAACIDNVEIVDLPVDAGNDMVKSVDTVLEQIAKEDAVPYIIAEIPTNPRVEVPELIELQKVLSKEHLTASGTKAVAPVFILDQTFCPNVHFLGENELLSTVKAIAYVSGSKFPSGGKCTGGYCVANEMTEPLMDKISLHLALCDNEATELQYELLAAQLPSMNQRITDAYKNTNEFVSFIKEILPTAKINFVSKELAEKGFTPSVFSLDLPTKGETDEERELYKRSLNLKLINKMITEIPTESKYCVSYGQLKGCYWTIPATSTQGTTKEGDKDYIARVALSAKMDLEKHKEVFREFVKEL